MPNICTGENSKFPPLLHMACDIYTTKHHMVVLVLNIYTISKHCGQVTKPDNYLVMKQCLVSQARPSYEKNRERVW